MHVVAERLELPPSDRLHCVYLARQELDDPAAEHVIWAHGHILRRC